MDVTFLQMEMVEQVDPNQQVALAGMRNSDCTGPSLRSATGIQWAKWHGCSQGMGTQSGLTLLQGGLPHGSVQKDVPIPQDGTAQTTYVEPGDLIEIFKDRLSFTVHESEEHSLAEIKSYRQRFYFSSDLQDSYIPFGSDFGPLSIAVMHEYCKLVNRHMSDPKLANRHLVNYCGNTKEERSNSAFALAAYLIVFHGFDTKQAARFFDCPGLEIAPFCDITSRNNNFSLSLHDVLNGLASGLRLGWYNPASFNILEYLDLEDPRIDATEVIPCKFVAFKGPSVKDTSMHVKAVVKLLGRIGVKVVIRLNEEDTYDKKIFTDSGMEHHECYFPDCTVPSSALIKRFLDICDQSKGSIAIHCFAGIGRTGTLIALWMMRTHKLSAKEAIAWLRLMRPGSVIGAQQDFLQACEGVSWTPDNMMILPPSLQSPVQAMKPAVPNCRRNTRIHPYRNARDNSLDAKQMSREIAEGMRRRMLAKMALLPGKPDKRRSSV